MRVPWEFENPHCAQVGVELFYPEVGNAERYHTQKAIEICKSCPHLTECAEWGINNERYGIWGGISQSKRKIIRKQRKIVLPREEYVAQFK
jgi:WhiB family redox-sensing transcriptional regulator